MNRKARTIVASLVGIAAVAAIVSVAFAGRDSRDLPNGHFTFAAFEGLGAGVAVIDHRQGNAIVQPLDYPGRPHGVDFARP